VESSDLKHRLVKKARRLTGYNLIDLIAIKTSNDILNLKQNNGKGMDFK